MVDLSLDERARLRREIERFDPEIPVERAQTPPASWYTSSAMSQLEFDTVYRVNWLYVGGADQVSTSGSYLTAEIAEEPVAVVRGDDGVLRGFSNVCRHHGACILTGTGQVESLRCPYHGWTYALDGRLKRAPSVGAIQDFRKEEFGLRPLPVVIWAGLVFVYLGEGQPPDLHGCLGPLGERLGALGQGASLAFHSRKVYDLACNWKVFIDNYLDGGYHVDTIHPGLASELDTGAYRIEAFEHFSIQSCPSGDAEPGQRMGTGALYAFVHPNLMINRYGPVLDVNMALPMGPDRCRVVFDYYFDAAASLSAEFIATCLQRSDQVQQEDIDICASVQKGLRSSAYDRGRYAPSVELAMHRFHRLLAREVASGL